MLKRLANLKVRTWLVIVTVIAVLERACLFIFYRPVSYNDTAGYRRSAEAIMNGWKLYDGTRLPGYPLFLMIAGPDERAYLAQVILGVGTTILFFYIGWRISGKGWFAAAAALAHTLNLQQLFFEADLISECLATFFVVLALAAAASLFTAHDATPPWKILSLALWGGLACAGAALVRPLFIFLPLAAAIFTLFFWRVRPGIRWGAVLVTGLVSLALIGSWVNFLHQRFGRWGLDTMTGYHLVQHTGAFFEFVPDQYAAIRDTYIQYRDERIAQTGAPGNTIWDAIPALEQVSGLGFYDLSDVLVKISLQLIREHPGLYLRSAWQGWLWFWKSPVYWSAGNISNPLAASLVGKLLLVERGGLLLANLCFLMGTLTLLWQKFRKTFRMDVFLWFVTASIWLTSILQTLPDHGDNPRFSVPIQSMVVFIVLWWVVRSVNGISEARKRI